MLRLASLRCSMRVGSAWSRLQPGPGGVSGKPGCRADGGDCLGG